MSTRFWERWKGVYSNYYKKTGYDADKLTMVFLFLTQAYIYKRMKLVKGRKWLATIFELDIDNSFEISSMRLAGRDLSNLEINIVLNKMNEMT